MQKKLLVVLALAAGIPGRAQLNVQDKGIVFLAPGALLTVQGDINSKADIHGAGTVLLKGMSLQRMNMNGHALFALQLDNEADAVLEGDVHIGSRVELHSGRISLNASNLFLEAGACVAGYDRDRFIVTNGAGMLVRMALDNTVFTYPVGSAADRYNPMTLSQRGDVHDIGVRTIPGTLTPAAVNVQWHLQELTPGRNDLVMTLEWAAGDERPGFDRTKGVLVRHAAGNNAEPAWSAIAVSEDGRYRIDGSSREGSGIFSVGMTDRPAGAIGLRVFPNPARTGFYVYLPAAPSLKTGGTYMLNLYDLRGRLMVSREMGRAGGEDYYFTLGELSAGTYLLQVMEEGVSVGSKKIVVVR